MTSAVIIVGAGPVGLSLAMDLAWRGVEVTVVEQRRAGVPPSVKCNHVAARSMEIFRRLGVARKLRDAGLPADYPNDVAYRTSFLGTELTRIEIPARATRYTAKDGPDGWWPTPEPPHRINQIYLEPVLFEHALSLGVRIVNAAEVESFEQNDRGVTAVVRDLETGDSFALAGSYLIGCDGGRSRIRRAIGARLEGDAMLQRVQSTYIRAPDLLPRLLAQGGVPAWGSFTINPRRTGNVYAIDGRETWLVHSYFRDDESDFEAVDRDRGIRDILGVEDDFAYEVIAKEDWVGRRLLADTFRAGRVFLCGDSAHLWVPFAGYGMNAGIADAMNLSWLIAARLKGWGGPDILDAYVAERRPITEQVSRFVMNHAIAVAGQRRAVPAAIEAEGPEGDAVRAAVGKAAYDLNVQQYCCAGLNFGYYYEGSPLIAYDGETPPPYTMAGFTASTVPGARVPHLWLADGRSLYDALGPDYTLLRFDPAVDAGPLLAAAAAKGVPMQLLDVVSPEAAGIYQEKLLLARPDQHVAWRGDALPGDVEGLVDLIRGAAAQVAQRQVA
jgi:2-polyprenyl-6-methoxyphenol hydroxylase-like FAD-dependent oxidoreductase